MKNFLVIAATLILSSAGFARSNIQTVHQVEAAKFVGTWYRISSNPIVFEPACSCARQVLTPNTDGTIAVYNSCTATKTGKLVEIRGTAKAEDTTYSKLAVNFGLPWSGQYWVIAVDHEYRYAVVTDSFGYSLYVMSKTPQLDPALYTQAVTEASAQVSTKHLEMQNQVNCTYP
jgi:apolipoprotein D and lipocalin family protein